MHLKWSESDLNAIKPYFDTDRTIALNPRRLPTILPQNVADDFVFLILRDGPC